MTKQEYHTHLCSVIAAVFGAEHAVLDRDPHLKESLRAHIITPEEYIILIADELLSATPDSELQQILNE